MSEKLHELPDKPLPSKKQPSTLQRVGLGLAIALFIIIVIIVGSLAYQANYQKINNASTDEIIIYIASWVILLVISVLSTLQIREIMHACSHNMFRNRANFIAIMIALVLTVFLFKQPFLETLFADYSTSGVIKGLLFLGGIGGGWLVWYLKHLKKYGEFFNVFLLTVIIGFCWYARLTAPEQIQLTAVAFLLGSLFHVAKDYLDKAEKMESDVQ